MAYTLGGAGVSPARRWEHRFYWADQNMVESEWWHGRRLSGAPRMVPRGLVETHYCRAHGCPIYPDLGCRVCGQRPQLGR